MQDLRERRRPFEELSRGAGIGIGEQLAKITAATDALQAHAAFAESIKAFTQPFGLLGAFDRRLPTDALAGVKMLESSALASVQRSALASLDVASQVKGLMPPPLSESLLKQIKTLDVSSMIGDHVKSVAASVVFDASNHIARLQEQLSEPLRGLADLFDGYEEDERLLLERLTPRGWLISPSMAIRTIRLLARELENSTDDEIDEALVGYFEAGECTRIVGDLYSDPTFDRMRPLLDEGLEAHRRGLFRPAILVWLAAIDGIAQERYGVYGVYSNVAKKNGAKLRATIERSTGATDPLQGALVEILLQVSLTMPDGALPNRHLVMHGRSVDYGNERASVQLMLVLEVMHHCAPLSIASAETPAALIAGAQQQWSKRG